MYIAVDYRVKTATCCPGRGESRHNTSSQRLLRGRHSVAQSRKKPAYVRVRLLPRNASLALFNESAERSANIEGAASIVNVLEVSSAKRYKC